MQCVLYRTVKALFVVNKALLAYCPHALVQANSPRRTASTTNHPAGAG